jgi:hypothetical protein
VFEDETMRRLVVLAGLAAVIGVAPPAGADPGGNNSGPDASFLAALDNAGISYKSGNVVVSVGRAACAMIDQGHPEAEVIKDVSDSNPGFTPSGATDFTNIAVNTYCPQHIGDPTDQPPQLTLPPTGIWPEFPMPTFNF